MSNRILSVLLLSVLFSCAKKGGHENLSFKDSVKLDQYLVEGRDLYLTNCSNCHQKDGKGLGKLYPPLNNSDYLVDNVDAVICLIRNGMSGEITVNGVEYNQPMPEMPNLTALEIAEITTYIYNNWTLKEGLVGVKRVEKVLETCSK